MIKTDNIDALLVIGILVFFGLIEIISGKLSNSKRSYSDWIQEMGGFFTLSLLIKPFIVLVVLSVGNFLFSDYQNIFLNTSLWLALPIYLLLDDILQYWYHRSAHEYNFLWKLHRAHHQAEEMGFFISYRNAGLYYLMMPNIWWIGIAVFLGAGKAVAFSLVAKQLIIIGSHSTLKWDKPFYQYAILKPIIAIIQRIIITPAFHHAHHGKSKQDGVSNPNGNFGNMFSIWDQMFGSAIFTQTYPEKYGLLINPKEHWSAAYFYPFIKSKDQKSELAGNFELIKTATIDPVKIELIKGEKYLWCSCGKSNNQPFCDGSHHGSKFKPVLFEAKQNGEIKLCNCKITKNAPYCDGEHRSLRV